MPSPADGLTVLMSVRNGQDYLEEALQSVYRQSYSRFELLVIDNGSVDATSAILAAQTDERLRVLRQEPGLSLAGALNLGLAQARFPWIARMDADDVCLPRRLEAQVHFLQQHPQVKLLGSAYEMFGVGVERVTGVGVRGGEGDSLPSANKWVVHPLTHPLDIAWHYTWESCLGHPTVMFPRELLRYPEASAQDYAAFARLSQTVRTANLPEVLLRYRWHGQNMSVVEKDSGELRSLQRANLERLGMQDDLQEAYLDWHLRRPVAPRLWPALVQANLQILSRLSQQLGYSPWPLHRPRLALTLLNRLRQHLRPHRPT